MYQEIIQTLAQSTHAIRRSEWKVPKAGTTVQAIEERATALFRSESGVAPHLHLLASLSSSYLHQVLPYSCTG